jgi:hypothetical protein
MADSPGGAAALRRAAPLGFRYQYLAGGVDTGHGWSTWNPNGSFVTRYDAESWAAGEIPVFSYYMLLQSNPAGGDEAQTDLAHRRDPGLMRAYHPSDATVRAYAARSASLYRALDAKFDVAFEDFSDRDAGFYAAQ